jgi:hypothetical protein
MKSMRHLAAQRAVSASSSSSSSSPNTPCGCPVSCGTVVQGTPTWPAAMWDAAPRATGYMYWTAGVVAAWSGPCIRVLHSLGPCRYASTSSTNTCVRSGRVVANLQRRRRPSFPSLPRAGAPDPSVVTRPHAHMLRLLPLAEQCASDWAWCQRGQVVVLMYLGHASQGGQEFPVPLNADNDMPRRTFVYRIVSSGALPGGSRQCWPWGCWANPGGRRWSLQPPGWQWQPGGRWCGSRCSPQPARQSRMRVNGGCCAVCTACKLHCTLRQQPHACGVVDGVCHCAQHMAHQATTCCDSRAYVATLHAPGAANK